jgi:hypothetical protein
MASKIQEAHLSMQPYRTGVWVWVCTPEEAKKAIKKTVYYTKYNCDTEAFIAHGGRCLSVDESNYEPIVWIDSNVKKSHRCINLSHEFVHVINRIFYCRGVELNAHNDEPFAYMMTYLMTQAKEKGLI